MMARILPREEWPRLNGTEAEALWPKLPDAARIVVVEHEGAIVGCHVLFNVLHAECLWVHPDHRKKTAVARRLWLAVKRTVREQFGVSHFATGCASREVERLLESVHAIELPAHFMVPVGE